MYNENLNHLTREKLNVGTVPTFDFFNIETVPKFKHFPNENPRTQSIITWYTCANWDHHSS